MLRSVLAPLAASLAVLSASSAQAGGHLSIGISLPIPGVIVTHGGYYAPPPPPVYYEPAPVVRYAPPPVMVQPEVYYAPPAWGEYRSPYREGRWDGRGDDRHWRHEHDRRERWEREHRDHNRDSYGPRHDR